MSQSSFQLLPAETSDMLEIARLEYLAFEHDPLLACAFPNRNSPTALSYRASSLSDQCASPSTRVTKIIDSENNICAAACWNLHLDPAWASMEMNTELLSKEIYGPNANIPLCENAFGRFDKTFKSLMGGKPCAKLAFLFVLPKFQRKGLGEQLMRSGLEEADRAHLPVWLKATKAGRSLYLKLGFKDLEYIDHDLSLYGGEGVVADVTMLRPAS